MALVGRKWFAVACEMAPILHVGIWQISVAFVFLLSVGDAWHCYNRVWDWFEFACVSSNCVVFTWCRDHGTFNGCYLKTAFLRRSFLKSCSIEDWFGERFLKWPVKPRKLWTSLTFVGWVAFCRSLYLPIFGWIPWGEILRPKKSNSFTMKWHFSLLRVISNAIEAFCKAGDAFVICFSVD